MQNCSQTATHAIRLSLVLLLLAPNGLLAEDHVVSPPDLRKAAAVASQVREANLNKVEKFFSSVPAQKALKRADIDRSKVQRAVSTLSDEELSRLAQRTDQVQQEIAAGSLSNQDLTYIVIALAAAVFVLIIVAA